MTGLLRRWVLFLCLAAMPAGCLVDGDHPCGTHQVLNDADLCVCTEGTVLSKKTGDCGPCPEYEVALGGACACEAGRIRDTASGTCLVSPQGLPCHPTNLPCQDPVFSLCAVDPAGVEGYCTSAGCASSVDCTNEYACVQSNGGSFCKRPPTGQGMACAQPADCAGLQASYCDTFNRVCRVSGCQLAQRGSCHEGWVCCDMTAWPFPGVPETMCVMSSEVGGVEGIGARCATL